MQEIMIVDEKKCSWCDSDSKKKPMNEPSKPKFCASKNKPLKRNERIMLPKRNTGVEEIP